MTYQFTCDATAVHVRQLLTDLRAALQNTSLDADLQNSVEIAVAEGLNNIVEHALKDAHGSQISVDMRVDAAHVFVFLRDPGAPMPDGCLPNAQAADLDVPMPQLPEGGFGWNIIHMLTDRLDYSRANGMNQLKMWFSTGTSASADKPDGPCKKP